MATYNGIIKRWNTSLNAGAGAYEEIYPATVVSQIIAGGTPSSSTFLRGDGNWETPSYSHAHSYAASSSAGGSATTVNETAVTDPGIGYTATYYVPLVGGLTGGQSNYTKSSFFIEIDNSDGWNLIRLYVPYMTTIASLAAGSTAITRSAGNNTSDVATCDFVNTEIDYRNGAQMGTDITATATFTTSHRNKFVRYTGASAGTLTIPLNTFNVGDEIHVLRYGAGEVTIARATSVSLYSEGSATENAGKKRINAQMQAVTMKCIATNTWVLFGALKT